MDDAPIEEELSSGSVLATSAIDPPSNKPPNEADDLDDDEPREGESQQQEAVRSAVKYNASLLMHRRLRGPFYYDAHTNSLHALGSWAVPELAFLTTEQRVRLS